MSGRVRDALLDALYPAHVACPLCTQERILGRDGLCAACADVRVCPSPTFSEPLDGLVSGLLYDGLARDAIHRALTDGGTDALNAVLEHGRVRRTLTEAGPADVVEVARPEWLAGWLAADDLLRLLGLAPHRIKQCGHPQCVLWFYDTSKNASRRWHSMTTCGNRLKAARHYAAKTSSDR